MTKALAIFEKGYLDQIYRCTLSYRGQQIIVLDERCSGVAFQRQLRP